ncbi:MAG: hypothetical protein V1875_09665 [Candidatus Altiarchaeota archaeon]
MDTSAVEIGQRIGRDETVRHFSGYYDPLFGVIPMPLIWNLLTVTLVALIFWWLLKGSQKKAHTAFETPLNLLKRRYASGEIDRKTFLQMREDLAD